MAVQVTQCKKVFVSHENSVDSDHEISDACHCNTCVFARKMLNNVSLKASSVLQPQYSDSSHTNSDSEFTYPKAETLKVSKRCKSSEQQRQEKGEKNYLNNGKQFNQFEGKKTQLSHDKQNEAVGERDSRSSYLEPEVKESLAERCQAIVKKLEAQLAMENSVLKCYHAENAHPQCVRQEKVCCCRLEYCCCRGMSKSHSPSLPATKGVELEINSRGFLARPESCENTSSPCQASCEAKDSREVQSTCEASSEAKDSCEVQNTCEASCDAKDSREIQNTCVASCDAKDPREVQNTCAAQDAREAETFFSSPCEPDEEAPPCNRWFCGQGDAVVPAHHVATGGMCRIVPQRPLSAPSTCCTPICRFMYNTCRPRCGPWSKLKQWDPSSCWVANPQRCTLSGPCAGKYSLTCPFGQPEPCQENINEHSPCRHQSYDSSKCAPPERQEHSSQPLPGQTSHCYPYPCKRPSSPCRHLQTHNLSNRCDSPHRLRISTSPCHHPFSTYQSSPCQMSPYMSSSFPSFPCHPPPYHRLSATNELPAVAQTTPTRQNSSYQPSPCHHAAFSKATQQLVLNLLPPPKRKCQSCTCQSTAFKPASSRTAPCQTASCQTAACHTVACQTASCQTASCQTASCQTAQFQHSPCDKLSCTKPSFVMPPFQESTCQRTSYTCQPSPCHVSLRRTPPCKLPLTQISCHSPSYHPPPGCHSRAFQPPLSQFQSHPCKSQTSETRPCQPQLCEPHPRQRHPSQLRPCQSPSCSHLFAPMPRICLPPPCAPHPLCVSRTVSCERRPSTLSLGVHERRDRCLVGVRPCAARTEKWVGDCQPRLATGTSLSCRGSTSQVCISESMGTSASGGASYYHSAMDLTESFDEDWHSACQKVNQRLVSLDDPSAKHCNGLMRSMVDSCPIPNCANKFHAEGVANGCIKPCRVRRNSCISGPSCVEQDAVYCHAPGEKECIPVTKNKFCCKPNIDCLIDESEMSGCAKLFKASLNRLRNLSLLPYYHCRDKCHCLPAPPCPGKEIKPAPCEKLVCVTPEPCRRIAQTCKLVFEPCKRVSKCGRPPTEMSCLRSNPSYKCRKINQCAMYCSPIIKGDSNLETDFKNHVSLFKPTLEQIKSMGNHKYESDTTSEGSALWHSTTDDMHVRMSPCPFSGRTVNIESHNSAPCNNNNAHSDTAMILSTLQNAAPPFDESFCPSLPCKNKNLIKRYTRIPEEVIRSAWDELIKRTMETMQGNCQENNDTTYSDSCSRILRCPSTTNSSILAYSLSKDDSQDGSSYSQKSYLNPNYCEAFGPAWDKIKELFSLNEGTEKNPEEKDQLDKMNSLLNIIQERLSIITNDTDFDITRLRGGCKDNPERGQKSTTKKEAVRFDDISHTTDTNYSTIPPKYDTSSILGRRNPPQPPTENYSRSLSEERHMPISAEKDDSDCKNQLASGNIHSNLKKPRPIKCNGETQKGKFLEKCNQCKGNLSQCVSHSPVENAPDVETIVRPQQSAKT